MSTKQVKELRQAGKLDEAYKMAADDLDKAPDDVWAKRSMVWCLYEYVKGSGPLLHSGMILSAVCKRWPTSTCLPMGTI